MEFGFTPVHGTLVRRYKRFFAEVRLSDSTSVIAHCPNTGRMQGCADAGLPVVLSRASNPDRKLAYTLELVYARDCWLNVNTLRPNALVHEAIEQQRIDAFKGWRVARREAVWGSSRFDLLLHRCDGDLESASSTCYVEVKNVTLFDGDVALFPDAVTARGTRHLDALVNVAASGARAVQLYVVNDPRCRVMRPADAIDPAYGAALRRAVSSGVDVVACAWATRVEGMDVAGEIAVELTPRPSS